MTDRLDIEVTYATILAAARESRLVSYEEIADAHNGNLFEVYDEIFDHLEDILKVCSKRNWPAITVIVVNPGTRVLNGMALVRFAFSVKSAGYRFDDAGKFVIDQTAWVFEWAKTASGIDKLNPADGEIRRLPAGIVGTNKWSAALPKTASATEDMPIRSAVT